MNSPLIRYILGYVLLIEGVLLILPFIVATYYGEEEGFYYLYVASASALLGILMTRKKPADTVFYFKEGCVATSLSWIFLSIVGCLPFVLTKEIPNFTDALFETVSGFTTTGASVVENVEALSRCSLFWRSFTHWIGGMGVLVFLLAIIPMSGGSNINLMRAESPGPSVGKLVPKVRQTARILYLIYFGLTVLEFLCLYFANMPIFDAVTTCFGTAGTGGFGIKCDSIGGYSPTIQWIVTVFMILFGVNFNAYYLLLFDSVKKAFSMEEVKWYFIIIFAAIALIMTDSIHIFSSIPEALRHTSFTVGSIITTTGFATTDFNQWSETSRFIIVALMFIGACAGSTGGGIKVSRFVIMAKNVGKELLHYAHPKSIKKIKMDDKPVEHEVIRSINVYFGTFLAIFVLSVMILTFEGYDLITNFTAVAATINNIGPGLELVGPTANFAFFGVVSKYVLIFDMLAGRLELFPLLILCYPPIWKDLFVQRMKKTQKSLNNL